jgi:hypothetical protein
LSKTDTPRERRRTAVITGASSGISQATAEAFATDSWNLVLAARSREDLETVAAHCRYAGAQVLVVPADVGDAEAVRKLAKISCEFADPIDLWFSNVGVGAVGKFLSAPPPLLDPRTVAAAVVRLADHPRSAAILGSPSWASRLSHFISPSLNARGIKGAFERYFAQAEPAPITDGNVLTPPNDGTRIGGGLRSPSQRRRDRDHGRSERIRARWRSTHDAQNGAPRLIPIGPTFEMPAPSVPTAVAADGKREEEEPAKEIRAGQQRRIRRQEVGWVPVLTITMPLNLVARRGQLPLAREECH